MLNTFRVMDKSNFDVWIRCMLNTFRVMDKSNQIFIERFDN